VKMWYDSLRVTSATSHEADEIPQIVVNGYSFAERCQRLGKAIEWVKREMVSAIVACYSCNAKVYMVTLHLICVVICMHLGHVGIVVHTL